MNSPAASRYIPPAGLRAAEQQLLVKKEEHRLLVLVILSGMALGTIAGVVSNLLPGEVIRRELRLDGATIFQQVTGQGVGLQNVSAPMPTGKSPSVVQRIRSERLAGHTRVQIDVPASVQYEAHELHNPERVFLDFENCRLGEDLPARIAVNNPPLRAIRVAQHTAQTARVVLDVEGGVGHAITRTPNGVVIEMVQ
jgi:hypothetical protein